MVWEHSLNRKQWNNDFVHRIATLAENWDYYEFFDSCETIENCESEIEQILDSKDGVQFFARFLENIIDETDDDTILIEAEKLKNLLFEIYQ